MTKIAILRADQNSRRCPLTSCLKCLAGRKEGFAGYPDTELVGVFTLSGDPEETLGLARILKAKGAEAIHVVTCAFAHKDQGGWVLGEGFVDDPDGLMERLAEDTGLPCVKGTAHLPPGYVPERF